MCLFESARRVAKRKNLNPRLDSESGNVEVRMAAAGRALGEQAAQGALQAGEE